MGWDRHNLLWDGMGWDRKICPMDKPGNYPKHNEYLGFNQLRNVVIETEMHVNR